MKRGLGHGKGFEVTDRYSLFDGSDPELLDLITERVAVLYDMLYEEEGTEGDISEFDEDLIE